MAVETQNLETPVLDSLISQQSVLQSKILANASRMNSFQDSINAWHDAMTTWWGLYMDDKDNILRKDRAAERLKKYQECYNKKQYYVGLFNTQKVDRDKNEAALAVVNKAIQDYYAAQATAISTGVPEGGSWEIAESTAMAVAAEGAANAALTEAEESKTTAGRNAIVIGGIIVLALLAWWFFKGRKSVKA